MNMNTKYFLYLLIFSQLSYASITGLKVNGVTTTQALVTYTATEDECFLVVSQNRDLSNPVNDINASVFAGVNSDVTNPVVKRYGLTRIWLVGKTWLTGLATGLDGKTKSRALQNAIPHYLQLSCGPLGSPTSQSAIIPFVTNTIPLGNTHIPNQPVDGMTGNWLQPTFSFTDRNEPQIDSNTGTRVGRTLMMRDLVTDDNTYYTVLSGAGAAWTNPNNVTAVGSYATYNGTAQDKLTAPIFRGIQPAYQPFSLDFVSVKITGSGDGATSAVRTVSACLRIIGDSLCAGDTVDFVFTNSPTDVYYNSGKVAGLYMGWSKANTLAITSGTVELVFWKKATSGSDTVSISNVQLLWGQSIYADPTSGGFHDICGVLDGNAWIKCVISGGLYAIHTTNAEVRFMGVFGFNNATMRGHVPDWNDISNTACQTFGDSSRLFDVSNPNVVYCNGLLRNHEHGIMKITLDATNTAVAQTSPSTFMYYIPSGVGGPSLLTPVGSDLTTLIKAFDPNVINGFVCNLDARQSTLLFGTCLAHNQNTPGHLFIFSLGNGTSINDPSCGVITQGHCSLSGVGIVAVNKTYDVDIAFGCTIHTTRSNGDVNALGHGGTSIPIDQVFGWEIGGWSSAQEYGDTPPKATLNASMNTTQTFMDLVSAWPTAVTTLTATVTTDDGDFGGFHARVIGSANFVPDITVGDNICVSVPIVQCRLVVFIEGAYMEIDHAFSPNVSGAVATGQPPAQPSDYAIGELISARFPRWMRPIRNRDFYVFPNGEMVRATSKVFMGTFTRVTIERGCTRDVSYPYVPCSGTGLAHTNTDVVTLSPNSVQDVLNAGSPAHYWQALLDPHATDSNYGDWPNLGLHKTWQVEAPYGYGGGHNAQRGNITFMAEYSATAIPSGSLTNIPAMMALPNNPIDEHTTFNGIYACSLGNGFQRHPSCTHANYRDGYQYNFCTDALQFVNCGPVSPPSQNLEGSIYKVFIPNDPNKPYRLNKKQLPITGVCGKSALLDISGPNSHVTTLTPFVHCTAIADGECRNSMDMGGQLLAGESVVNCPGTTSLICSGTETWDGHTNDICLGNKVYDGNSSTQFTYTVPTDFHTIDYTSTAGARPIVTLGASPRVLANYANMKTSPDGGYGFHPAGTNVFNQILLATLPYIPARDSIQRNDFIKANIRVNPPQNLGITNAVIEFGYDDTLFCTTRLEVCVAAGNPTALDPFYYASEVGYTGTVCVTSCVIPVPSYPNRMLHTRIRYRNAGNATVLLDRINVTPIP